MNDRQLLIIRILAVVLMALLTVVSFFGAFVKDTYSRDVASMAAQGMGQDLVNLFIIVPLLLVSLIHLQKNSKTATFVFGGTVLYILYSFTIYSLGVHFNNMFLLYCLILGCSFYLFIYYIISLNTLGVKKWFEDRIPVKTTGVYFIIIAAMFYVLWLSDIAPAIINNSTPKTVSEYDLLVNPVHVMDIAIVLPGLIITAILIMRRIQLGFVFAPILLVFTILLTIALAAMVIALQFKNIADDSFVAGIFGVLAVISFVFLSLFLRKIKKGIAL